MPSIANPFLRETLSPRRQVYRKHQGAL